MSKNTIIPQGWEEKQLGKLVFQPKNHDIDKNILSKCIELEHLEKNTGVITGYSQFNGNLSSKNIFVKYNVLFGKLRPYLRKYAFPDFNGVCSSEIWVLASKSNKITNEFIYLLVQNDEFINYANITSGTKMPRADWKHVQNYFFLLPPLAEQEKIAEILNACDKVIENYSKILELKTTYKKALMQNLLSGKVRLKGFEGKWENVELVSILDYERPEAYIADEVIEYNKDLIPVLTANKSFVIGSTKEKKGVYRKSSAIIFDDFTTDTKFVDFPFKVKSSAIKIITTKPNANIYFVFAQMQLVRFIVGNHKRHYISEYQHIFIPLPPLPEQEAIAEVLTTADHEIEKINALIAQYKQLKKFLMQNLLTGKIRVKV